MAQISQLCDSNPTMNLKFAIVCSSNQNRSMEAHNFLSKKGYRVKSFGTGTQVKLPGPAHDRPNIYDFNTTYDEMYRDLMDKNPELYPICSMGSSYVANGLHPYFLKT